MKNLKRYDTEAEFAIGTKVTPQISFVDETKRINYYKAPPVNYNITVPKAYVDAYDDVIKKTVTIDGVSEPIKSTVIPVISTQKVSLKIEVVNPDVLPIRLGDISCTPMIKECVYTMDDYDACIMIEITDWEPNQNLEITGVIR